MRCKYQIVNLKIIMINKFKNNNHKKVRYYKIWLNRNKNMNKIIHILMEIKKTEIMKISKY